MLRSVCRSFKKVLPGGSGLPRGAGWPVRGGGTTLATVELKGTHGSTACGEVPFTRSTVHAMFSGSLGRASLMVTQGVLHKPAKHQRLGLDRDEVERVSLERYDERVRQLVLAHRFA